MKRFLISSSAFSYGVLFGFGFALGRWYINYMAAEREKRARLLEYKTQYLNEIKAERVRYKDGDKPAQKAHLYDDKYKPDPFHYKETL